MVGKDEIRYEFLKISKTVNGEYETKSLHYEIRCKQGDPCG